jgi:integrase
LGTYERLAFAVLLYTGQRISDVAKILRTDVRNGAIRVIPQKTSEGDEHETEELWIAIHPDLVRAIAAGPTHLTQLIATRHGNPFKAETLGAFIRRAAKNAGLSPRCTAHGLRKAAIRRLAEHGATTKQIAAISGHKDLAMIELYTAAADRKKLAKAGIRKLPKGQSD